MSKTIIIHCPVCKKRNTVEISDSIVNNEKPIIAVNITEFKDCGHNFIIYIDKNFTVRDSFILDYKVEIPHLESFLEEIEQEDQYTFDIELIKINLIPTTIALILKSIFNGEKIIILSNQSFINENYKNFFEALTKDSFNTEILFITQKEYREQKKKFKKQLVIDGNKILNDPNKTTNLHKLKIE